MGPSGVNSYRRRKTRGSQRKASDEVETSYARGRNGNRSFLENPVYPSSSRDPIANHVKAVPQAPKPQTPPYRFNGQSNWEASSLPLLSIAQPSPTSTFTFDLSPSSLALTAFASESDHLTVTGNSPTHRHRGTCRPHQPCMSPSPLSLLFPSTHSMLTRKTCLTPQIRPGVRTTPTLPICNTRPSRRFQLQ